MDCPRGLPHRLSWRQVAFGLLCAWLALPAAAQKNGEDAGQKQAVESPAPDDSADPGNRPPLRLVPLPGDTRVDDSSTIRVVGNIFFDLPGLDLTTLTPRQKERFLQRVNTEHCACGRGNCINDPVANCFINDPGCSHAKVQAKRILHEVKAGK
jgi:hypothetical protein